MSFGARATIGLASMLAAAALRAQSAAGPAPTGGGEPLIPLHPAVPVPRIDGDWWRIAGNPDLGACTSPEQQPVDFAIWQAADGTWQLWSCIRNTRCGGMTRLFHRWEGRRLGDANWKPMGIAMQADPALGETPGGLQAPYVWREDGVYHLVYGDWQRICHATSKDGKRFERVRNERGQPDLFQGPYDNTRDPMVLKVGDLHLCYYTGHKQGAEPQAAVFCRTSHDLVVWSEPVVVSGGGELSRHGWFGGNCECPFVLQKDGTCYLFRNAVYGPNNLNVQYASPNPFRFGVGDDRCAVGWLPVAAPEIVVVKDQYYIAALEPALDGIRVAKLRWVKS